MKKPLYLAFCLTVAMSLGCVALTYPNITDNEGSGQFTVVTKGAHLEETTQTSQTSGARRIEHVSFLDQDQDGEHRIRGFALELAVGTSEFHSDTFCNSNFAGKKNDVACQWLSHFYTPPGPCSFTAPGVRIDEDCLGDFSAIGLCFTSRPGECGQHSSDFNIPPGNPHCGGNHGFGKAGMKGCKGKGGDALRTDLAAGELQALLDAGVEDSSGILNYAINAGNTSLVFDNGTDTFTPTVAGNYVIPYNMTQGYVNFDASSSSHAINLRTLADMIDESGQSDWTFTVTYHGVTRSGKVTFLEGDHYRRIANTNY